MDHVERLVDTGGPTTPGRELRAAVVAAHAQERAPGRRGPGRRGRLRLRRAVRRPLAGAHHDATATSRPATSSRPSLGAPRRRRGGRGAPSTPRQHPALVEARPRRGRAGRRDPRRGRHQLPERRRPGQEHRVVRREGRPQPRRRPALPRPAARHRRPARRPGDHLRRATTSRRSPPCSPSSSWSLDDRDLGELTASEGRFGYASRHLQVELDGREVQVQLRTVLQHAWAEFEHDIRYKGEVPAEHANEFDRRFTLAAGLLELADQEFSAIRDRLRGPAPRAEADDDDPRIAPRELAAFLAGQYADAGWSRTDHYDWISGLLLELGITTPGRAGRGAARAPTTTTIQRADGLPLPARRRTPPRRRAAHGLRRPLRRPARQRAPPRGRSSSPARTKLRDELGPSEPLLDNRRDLSHDGDMTDSSVPAAGGVPCRAVARPGAARGPAYAALRDHDPVHHVVPERPAATHDYYVLTRHDDVLAAAVDTATFSSRAGAHRRVRRAGEDRPGRQPADGDAGPARPHGVPPAGQPRLHAARRCATSSPRSAPTSPSGSTGSPRAAAATSSWSCSSRCRAWSWRTTSASRPRTATGSTPGPTRSSRPARPGDPTDAAERRPRRCSATSASSSSGAVASRATTRSRTWWRPASATTTPGCVVDPRLRLRDGHRRQRHDDRRARRRRPAARRAPGPARPPRRRPDPGQGRGRGVPAAHLAGAGRWPGRPPATSSCTASRSRPAARCCSCYGAANRDPRRYGPDADELDVRRAPSQILTFGQGSHHCLGNAAARMQARVALEELLARIPHFAVDVDAVRWAPGPYVRRPLTLPFEVTA